MQHLWPRLWRLPLLVGAGALFTWGARATTVPNGSGDAPHSGGAMRHRGGEVILKIEHDNIYLSEDSGRTFRELELTATPAAHRLKRLVAEGAASSSDNGVKTSPTLVADGAGGLQWSRPKPTSDHDAGNRAQQPVTQVQSAATGKAHPPAEATGTAPSRP